MPAFQHQGLSATQIADLARLANASYAGIAAPPGWTRLDGATVGGGAYTGETFTNGGAAAQVFRQGDTLALAFRGSDSAGDFLDFPALLFGTGYLDNFNALLNALAAYAAASGVAQILVTGHSLGGAAAGMLRDLSASRYGGAFDAAGFVTIASPRMGADGDILNIGFENDWVFQAVDRLNPFGADTFASATDNIVWYNDRYAQTADTIRSLTEALDQEPDYPHASLNHIDAIERIVASEFYDRMARDSVIIVVATDRPVSDHAVEGNDHFGAPAFYIGRDSADIIIGGTAGDSIEGAGGNDFLMGGAGDDSLLGGAGDDELDGGAGNDTLDGGAGTDVVRYWGDTAGVSVDMEAPGQNVSGNAAIGQDRITGVEELVGGFGADTIRADGADNLLVGLDGADLLEGRAGADTLMGNAGADTLRGGDGDDVIDPGGPAEGDVMTGGAGEDTFIFTGGTATITDFEDGADFVILAGLGLSAAGDLVITQSGGDAIVSDTDGSFQLTFEMTDIADLGVADFLFA